MQHRFHKSFNSLDPRALSKPHTPHGEMLTPIRYTWEPPVAEVSPPLYSPGYDFDVPRGAPEFPGERADPEQDP